VTGYLLTSLISSSGCATQSTSASSTSTSGITQPEGLAADSYGDIAVSNSSANTVTFYTNAVLGGFNPITGPPELTLH
jgi:hypothetical protein